MPTTSPSSLKAGLRGGMGRRGEGVSAELVGVGGRATEATAPRVRATGPCCRPRPQRSLLLLLLLRLPRTASQPSKPGCALG